MVKEPPPAAIGRRSGAWLIGALLIGGLAAATSPVLAHQPHKMPYGARYRQVADFDGHDLFVQYQCGDEAVAVRFLGYAADATTPDGAVHRMQRTREPKPRRVNYVPKRWVGYVDYVNDAGYALTGHGLAPTWTAPNAQPVACKAARSSLR